MIYNEHNEPENDFDIRLSDIVAASFGTLAAIGRGKLGWRAFTWSNDATSFEPLIVDAFTASAMVQIYDALGGANQAKFKRMVGASRGSFARLMEFAWKQAA